MSSHVFWKKKEKYNRPTRRKEKKKGFERVILKKFFSLKLYFWYFYFEIINLLRAAVTPIVVQTRWPESTKSPPPDDEEELLMELIITTFELIITVANKTANILNNVDVGNVTLLVSIDVQFNVDISIWLRLVNLLLMAQHTHKFDSHLINILSFFLFSTRFHFKKEPSVTGFTLFPFFSLSTTTSYRILIWPVVVIVVVVALYLTRSPKMFRGLTNNNVQQFTSTMSILSSFSNSFFLLLLLLLLRPLLLLLVQLISHVERFHLTIQLLFAFFLVFPSSGFTMEPNVGCTSTSSCFVCPFS